MEALVAVGLAGNVVQFLQGAGTLIAEANAIRRNGSPSPLPQLRSLSKTLTDQAAVLRTRLKACSATLKEEDQASQCLCGRIAFANCVTQNLLDLAAECEEAGTQFITYLESFKSHSSSKLLQSAKKAIKFQWSSHKIDDFAVKLDKLRGSLTLGTVLALRTSSESRNDEILGHLKAIQQDHKARNLDETDIRTAVETLADAIQDQASDKLDVIQDEIRLCLDEISSLRSERTPEEKSRSLESRVLRWLDFRQIFWRYKSVATAYQRTYEWIYDSPIMHNRWSDFPKYLQQDTGEPYFISGKAGSGKSTLMKSLYGHSSTGTALKKWAGTSELMKLHFFFWDLGTTLQKTHVGMLRALLHTVLDEHPELVPAVFPRLYRNWKASDADIEPQYVEVKEAFERLIEKSHFLKLAIFIDGIDEFDGNHRDMALFLRSLASPHVKLIVSSRPVNACLDVLAGCPTLRLQELTRPDMERFVHGELSSNYSMGRLMEQFPERAPQLIEDLLDKAEGVFLWIKLVVRLLVDGLQNGDNLEELHAKLTLLPSDLRDLYKNMFGKMKLEYQKQAAVIFQLLDRWRRCINIQPLPGVVLSYAIRSPTEVFQASIAPMTGETFSWIMETLEKRIRSRCCGLLEVRYNDDKETVAGWATTQYITIDKINRGVVTYLHRTVAEFIATTEVWQEVCELTNDMALDSTSSLTSACLSTMKLASQYDDDGLKWYLETTASFCQRATTTEPQTTQKYVYEMDHIMSRFQQRSRRPYDGRSRVRTLHWSAEPHDVEPVESALAVEEHKSIHTFAARRGILAHLLLLPFGVGDEERFVIVLNALLIWRKRLFRALNNSGSLGNATELLSYLLRNVWGPESIAFSTSLWQQALVWCTDMKADHYSILEAARLMKVLLSAVDAPQSLWQRSVQAWKDFILGPTHVLESFRAHAEDNPSPENITLLNNLEHLTGTRGNRPAAPVAGHEGIKINPSSQASRMKGKKTRRNKKIKLRAADRAS
ncbi:hypothetical protein AA0112_g9259 [Alternaria arborescens]|nr:hypothetical protein AA0112_g9259 [Alternaria arborescens]